MSGLELVKVAEDDAGRLNREGGSPADVRVVTAVSVILVSLIGGAILGAIGGWIGGRTQVPAAPPPAN
jgi:hypothetical protein